MFCNHCGNNLPTGSLFCNRCGNQVPGGASNRPKRNIPPPMARPARRQIQIEEDGFEDVELYDEEPEYDDYDEEEFEEDDHEKVIFSISPAFYGVGIRYFVAISLSVAVTALISLYLPLASLWIALGVSSVILLNPIYHHIQHHRIIYTLTTVKLEIKSGLFAKTSKNIPLRHIQDVTVIQTLKERLLGIGDVVIDSAVIEGTMPLSHINDPRKYADLILNELQYWN
ncbi:MAG: PH domain-containing protein [Acidobacteria bacterium]|nr:PH domain-containing protein [Acidobacteriota bacterium]